MVVTADAQIANIDVLVERAPMAAALSGDVTGRVPLKLKMGAQVGNKVRILEWMLIAPTPPLKVSQEASNTRTIIG